MVDQKLKAKAVHRLKIIEGQVRALVAAIEAEKYCVGLLSQSRSIQNSMKSLDRLLLENHLKTHVRHQMRKAGEDERAIKELIEVYTLSNR